VTAPLSGIRVGGSVEAADLGDLVVVTGLAARDDPQTFGLTYEPSTGRFGSVPAVPFHPMSTPRQAVAAGGQVLVLQTGPASAATWSPGREAWRSAPDTLVRGPEAAVVWTGAEVLIWGGSVNGDPRADGVAWTP
jgi:hypothetical protein